MFVSYSVVETKDGGQTWFFNGQDVSKTGLNYSVATMKYAYGHTKLNDSAVAVLKVYSMTQTKSLVNYLPTKYPTSAIFFFLFIRNTFSPTDNQKSCLVFSATYQTQLII